MNKTNSMGCSLSIEEILERDDPKEDEVAKLYEAFPRDKRKMLHSAIMLDRKNPFNYRRNDSQYRRAIGLMVSNDTTPMADSNLSQILSTLKLGGNKRRAMVQCFQTHMHAIQPI